MNRGQRSAHARIWVVLALALAAALGWALLRRSVRPLDASGSSHREVAP